MYSKYEYLFLGDDNRPNLLTGKISIDIIQNNACLFLNPENPERAILGLTAPPPITSSVMHTLRN